MWLVEALRLLLEQVGQEVRGEKNQKSNQRQRKEDWQRRTQKDCLAIRLACQLPQAACAEPQEALALVHARCVLGVMASYIPCFRDLSKRWEESVCVTEALGKGVAVAK